MLVLVLPGVFEHCRQRFPGRWIIGGETHLLAESRGRRRETRRSSPMGTLNLKARSNRVKANEKTSRVR